MRPVFQYLQTFFYQFWFIGGYRKDINCFIKTCIGIQVGTKLYADALQVVYQFILRKAFGAIKVHVFHEMGKAQLVIIFHDGSGVDHQAQFHSLFGFTVMPYVISHTIGQPANFYFRINRHRLFPVDLRPGPGR